LRSALHRLREGLSPTELCLVNRNNAQLFSTYSRRENDLYDLMGYEGSAGILLVRRLEVILLVDGRYLEVCRQWYGGDPLENIVVELREDWVARRLLPWCERFRGRGRGLISVDHARWSASELDQLKRKAEGVSWKDRVFSTPKVIAEKNSSEAEMLFAEKESQKDDEKASGFWHFVDHETSKKCELLRTHIKEGELHVVTCPDDVAWLMGIRANDFDYRRSVDGVILLTRQDAMMFKDMTTDEQAELEAFRDGWVVVPKKNAWAQLLEAFLQKRSYRCCVPYHARPGGLNARDFKVLEAVSDEVLPLKPLKRSLCELGRLEKSSVEVDKMAWAQGKLSQVMAMTIDYIRHEVEAGRGCRELAVVTVANGFAEQLGAIRPCFPAMVASGEHSRFPHHQPTDRLIKKGEVILLDLGYYFGEGAYATDMSRTMFTGIGKESHSVHRKVYTMVLTGFLRQWGQKFREGTFMGCHLDALARSYFDQALDFPYSFIHSTGHGVGVSDHELGITIGPSSHLTLRPGYTYSLEPGLYRDQLSDSVWLNFGVRIEDVVTVTQTTEGCQHRSLGHGVLEESLIDGALMDDSDLELLDRYRLGL
jgi:Xaa-Pro aminopeptidase